MWSKKVIQLLFAKKKKNLMSINIFRFVSSSYFTRSIILPIQTVVIVTTKVLRRKKSLKWHLDRECGLPPKYQCPQCMKYCPRKHNLMKHCLFVHKLYLHWNKYKMIRFLLTLKSHFFFRVITYNFIVNFHFSVNIYIYTYLPT